MPVAINRNLISLGYLSGIEIVRIPVPYCHRDGPDLQPSRPGYFITYHCVYAHANTHLDWTQLPPHQYIPSGFDLIKSFELLQHIDRCSSCSLFRVVECHMISLQCCTITVGQCLSQKLVVCHLFWQIMYSNLRRFLKSTRYE